jgi:hypothetical protein
LVFATQAGCTGNAAVSQIACGALDLRLGGRFSKNAGKKTPQALWCRIRLMLAVGMVTRCGITNYKDTGEGRLKKGRATEARLYHALAE